MSSISSVFFREKPVEMLTLLLHSEKELYPSTIAKKVDVTYSHAVKVLQDMEKVDLVRADRHGRLKLITLTSKGREIAEHFSSAKTLLRSRGSL